MGEFQVIQVKVLLCEFQVTFRCFSSNFFGDNFEWGFGVILSDFQVDFGCNFRWLIELMESQVFLCIGVNLNFGITHMHAHAHTLKVRGLGTASNCTYLMPSMSAS